MEQKPTPEAEAALDAIFEQAAMLPPEPPDPGPPLIPDAGFSLPALPDPPAVPPLAKPSADSPLRDYVREIQQEFEEQEDEGKL